MAPTSFTGGELVYKSEREELRVSATGEASGEGRNLSASPRPCLLSLPVLQQPWGRNSQEELRPTAVDLGSEVSKCRKHSGVGVQAQPLLQKIIIFKKWIKNCCEGAKRDFIFFLGPLATSVGTQQYCFQKARSLSPKSLACLGTPLLLPFPPLQKSPTQL